MRVIDHVEGIPIEPGQIPHVALVQVQLQAMGTGRFPIAFQLFVRQVQNGDLRTKQGQAGGLLTSTPCQHQYPFPFRRIHQPFGVQEAACLCTVQAKERSGIKHPCLGKGVPACAVLRAQLPVLVPGPPACQSASVAFCHFRLPGPHVTTQCRIPVSSARSVPGRRGTVEP